MQGICSSPTGTIKITLQGSGTQTSQAVCENTAFPSTDLQSADVRLRVSYKLEFSLTHVFSG